MLPTPPPQPPPGLRLPPLPAAQTGSGPISPPSLPPGLQAPPALQGTPPDTPGLTNHMGVNMGVGGGVAGGANGGISATSGWEAVVIGGVVALVLSGIWATAFFKKRPYLKWPLSAAICVITGLVVFGLAGHAQLDTAVAKGCAMVLAGLADEFGVLASGITSFLPGTGGQQGAAQ